MLENQIVEAIVTASGVVLTGVFGYVGKTVAKFIKSHHAEKLALAAVQYAESTFKEMSGHYKFTKAADWLVDELEKIGLKNISDKKIEVLVQSAYQKMLTEIEQAFIYEKEVAKSDAPTTSADDKKEVEQSAAPEPQQDPEPAQPVSNDQVYRRALAKQSQPEPKPTLADMTMDDLKNAIADVINKQPAPAQSVPQTQVAQPVQPQQSQVSQPITAQSQPNQA